MWPSVHRILQVQSDLARLALDPTRYLTASSDRVRACVADAMAHADVVLWEAAIENVAVAGSRSLQGIHPVRRPPVTQWWCRAEESWLPSVTAAEGGCRWSILWQLWMPSICETDGGLDQLGLGFLVPENLESNTGKLWDELRIALVAKICPARPIGDDESTPDWLYAEYEFLRSKVVGTQVIGPNRGHRRWWATENGSMLTQQIRRVVLRRCADTQIATDGTRMVDWSCQWMVRGHWRAQFYPSSQCHRPVWITPHIKGPDHKPMKQSASKTIYHASR